ncbi:hypothetical protein L226DRAFT_149404 [Lentinus tigrinus ALCF2SS1-7]|uniref:uncharacterized protein n=1 Tax=Lentinus tigrinus ALCF2SS1-7 TaxID=1328758 RepID=UPI001165D48E|nr:hypothetical protein L226DRAFT_149404 [Lentinus tigrinus ALCF2SS1-7]
MSTRSFCPQLQIPCPVLEAAALIYYERRYGHNARFYYSALSRRQHGLHLPNSSVHDLQPRTQSRKRKLAGACSRLEAGGEAEEQKWLQSVQTEEGWADVLVHLTVAADLRGRAWCSPPSRMTSCSYICEFLTAMRKISRVLADLWHRRWTF